MERAVTTAAVLEAAAGELTGQIRLRKGVPDEVADAKSERRSCTLGTALAHR